MISEHLTSQRRSCARCAKEGVTTYKTFDWIETPYRQNGWVGGQFVPWHYKIKGGRRKDLSLCGMCYASHTVKDMRERGEDVTEIELELLEIAKGAVVSSAPSGNANPSVKAKSTPKRRRRQRITASNANNFDAIDVDRADTVESAVACECKAYVDILTFRRWLALGTPVRRGQRAIQGTRPALFCRCQVAEVAA